VFFSRQADSSCAFNGQRVIAAEKGKKTVSVLVGVNLLNIWQEYARQLPLSGWAGNNPASCREKNTPTPQLYLQKI
jgi:hypothetical protein